MNAEHDPWAAATFEGARKAQTKEFAQLSLTERLRWCCEMSELIRKNEIAHGRIPPALKSDRHRKNP